MSSRPGTIITADNWEQFRRPQLEIDGQLVSDTGYIARDLKANPVGSKYYTKPFPKELLIPRSEWSAIIKAKAEAKARLSDLCTASQVRWLNQSPSWYCWCYAVVQAMLIVNITQNNPLKQLVPESVAGPIMNFRKRGGNGSDALKWIVEHGCCDTSVWPWENHRQANQRKYWTDAAKANAKKNIIPEWYDLRTFEEKASLLLRNIPVPSGYWWMGHEMCSIDLIEIEPGYFGCLDLDSYARSGKYNTQALDEEKGRGDDMVAPLVVTPNLGAIA